MSSHSIQKNWTVCYLISDRSIRRAIDQHDHHLMSREPKFDQQFTSTALSRRATHSTDLRNSIAVWKTHSLHCIKPDNKSFSWLNQSHCNSRIAKRWVNWTVFPFSSGIAFSFQLTPDSCCMFIIQLDVRNNTHIPTHGDKCNESIYHYAVISHFSKDKIRNGTKAHLLFVSTKMSVSKFHCYARNECIFGIL